MDKIINDSWNKTSDDTRIFIQEKVIHEIDLSSFSNSLSIYMNLQLELDNWTLIIQLVRALYRKRWTAGSIHARGPNITW
jgi:hypothetical protein